MQFVLNTFSFFTAYKILAPDTKEYSMPFHEITTDKSFANINAITCALNLKTLPQYLEECYDILQQSNSSSRTLDGLVVIRLCSSHTTKTIYDDVRKHYVEHECLPINRGHV